MRGKKVSLIWILEEADQFDSRRRRKKERREILIVSLNKLLLSYVWYGFIKSLDIFLT